MSRELVDLDRLPKKMRDRLSSALSPEERLVVSIKGIGGALLATDRQILLWQRSTLTSYPLTSVSGIEWNLRGFNKWLRIAGDGLEEERPTFRNLPTRKNALGIGQTPQEQRDALSQLVGTSAPPTVVASVDASAPRLDVTPPRQQAPIEQPPAAGSGSVLEKDSVNDRRAGPGYATGQQGGWKAQIAPQVEPRQVTLDPLATGPKDLAEYEALRQAHLGPKRPIEKDTKVPQFVSEFTLPHQQDLPAGHDAASRAALERSERELERARIEKDTTTLAEYDDIRRVRLSKRPSFGQALMAAVRVGNAKAAEDRRARNALKYLRPRRKSAAGPLLIAVIAGIAYLVMTTHPAPPTAPAASAGQDERQSWPAFVARTVAWSSVVAADARALSGDGSAYDTAAMAVDARTLKADSEEYGSWLSHHGFTTCYHPIWTAALTAAAAYVQAGTAAAKWADAAPDGNPNDLAAATNFMNEGSSSLDQATGLLHTVSCP